MSIQEAEGQEYRNKAIINQRGATIVVNNSTDREELKLSQYAGSNISIGNLVTSELAVNNKQTKIDNDSFETVGKDKNSFVGKDKVERVVENTYIFRGVKNEEEIEKTKEWKDQYKPIADKNSKFRIQRGGVSFPNGVYSNESGSRTRNSTFNQERAVVENTYDQYAPQPQPVGLSNSRYAARFTSPVVSSDTDQVELYDPVFPKETQGPIIKSPDPIGDIEAGSGKSGIATNAPGVLEFGPMDNAATEAGDWAPDPGHQSLPDDIVKLQDTLNEIEEKMGTGGDEISFVKRHKIETIGAVTNDYPSTRIDPKGRSQPIEVAVGENMPYVNMDYVPHVEEIDNDMNFPVGDYTLNVGNRYNVLVGSGGIQFKSSGSVEIGGTSFKAAAHKVNIQGAAGVDISSESVVELQSLKSIALRSNRQVFIEPGLGVKNNIVVGGGLYAEGEIYIQHITAPVEIQETEDTTVMGKFNTSKPAKSETFKIGEAKIPAKIAKTTKDGFPFPHDHSWPKKDVWVDVYADPTENLIVNYPHSHHFKNLPLRLVASNKDVRKFAQEEHINVNGMGSYSQEQKHEKKQPIPVAAVAGKGNRACPLGPNAARNHDHFRLKGIDPVTSEGVGAPGEGQVESVAQSFQRDPDQRWGDIEKSLPNSQNTGIS